MSRATPAGIFLLVSEVLTHVLHHESAAELALCVRLITDGLYILATPPRAQNNWTKLVSYQPPKFDQSVHCLDNHAANTLRSHRAIQCIAIHKDAFLCAAAMSLEDVHRLDGILHLPFVVGAFYRHCCVHNHVGEEVTISTNKKRLLQYLSAKIRALSVHKASGSHNSISSLTTCCCFRVVHGF